MAAAVRGPATGRFFRAFHAWSRLGNVTHQQRRCFVSNGSLYEANVDKSSHSETPQAPRSRRPTTRVRIPQARFERIQQHPDFLQRMHAALDATIQPDGGPDNDGSRLVRIQAPSTRLCRYVRNLLMRRNDDSRTLDNTVFNKDNSAETTQNVQNATIDLKFDLPTETATLLQDNADELKLRIQDTFSVQLDLVPEQDGVTNDGMRTIAIVGARKDVNLAKDFITSLHYELDLSSGHGKQQSNKSLETPPQPSPVSSEPKKKPLTKQEVYKSIMRSVPSSVVVLTTSVSPSTSDMELFRGMTVSSLTSVTLEPEPIISFSIRGPSRTLDCITAGRPFAVNFLSTHSVGARIADIFSKPHDNPSQPFHAVQNLNLAKIWAKDGDPAPPVISGKDIPARFTCELLPGKSLEVGDHTVIFARVTNVYRTQRLINLQHSGHVTFLAYAQAGYRFLAPESIEWPAAQILKPTQSRKSAPSTPKGPPPQLPETKAEPEEVEVFDEDVAVPTKADAASEDVVDAYWRMALDEDKVDSVLEERAADQRALGEAQKPADHPAADVQNDLADQPSLKKQDS
ncbi:hypothetical protein KCU81_g415, partial [Aureobasidium melanogenum]|uniref:Flavin reductase like domain-containing protein n=1 Tax=Aureobasidium melanogenum (strain CBS 110374) TaxID=1043003 RepID=A0A074W7D9_AURM1